MSKISLSAAFADKTTQKKLRIGTYRSKVTSVVYSEKHVAGSAIVIHYKLTAGNGDVFDYSEYFYLDGRNPRSQVFFAYLEESGIDPDDLGQFEGCAEELVLKKSTNSRFLTIESRRFLGKAED